ncbi:MAG TPA: cyclic nucleotide-binding domain-containing protein [Anaerolineaceae bacterium]|jgi:CRP/FNR family transcriptional regulator, cyclic AMP receptor protein
MFRQELAQVSLFKDLCPEDLDFVAPLLEPVDLAQNEVIFEQGRIAEHLYILLEGEVVVNFKPYDGPQLTVAHIHSGGVFGWSAILGRQVYTSIALAAVDSVAIRMRGEELRSLCEEKPQTGLAILERLAGVIAERLNSTHAQIFTMLTESMDLTVSS